MTCGLESGKGHLEISPCCFHTPWMLALPGLCGSFPSPLRCSRVPGHTHMSITRSGRAALLTTNSRMERDPGSQEGPELGWGEGGGLAWSTPPQSQM